MQNVVNFDDADNGTLPIPLKYVDVMKQPQTNIKNVSEHFINDDRYEGCQFF